MNHKNDLVLIKLYVNFSANEKNLDAYQENLNETNNDIFISKYIRSFFDLTVRLY